MRRMKWIVFVLVLAVTAPPAAVPAFAATMYAVGFDATNSPVYTIDTVTGVQTFLGNSGIANLNSLTMSSTGQLYSVGGAPGSEVLVTIDPFTGAGATVAAVNTGAFQSNIRALAFDANGTLYASNRPSSGMGSGAARLFTIDPVTGVGTVFNSFGPPDMQALDVSPANALYGVSPTTGLNLVRTNPIVLPVIQIGTMGANTIESIAFDPSGTLWGVETGVSGGSLYTIDTTTGVRTLAFNNGLSGNLRGIEFAPVPVPAAVWLFGSGLAAMVGFARRK